MKILHVINTFDVGGAQSLLVEMAVMQVTMGYDVQILQLVKSRTQILEEKVMERGIKLYTLSLNQSVYNPFHIFSLIKYLRSYEIVHVHLFPAQYWVAFAKWLSFSKTLLVTTEHNTFNKRRNHWLLHNIDTFIYKNAYKVVVACADVALKSFKRKYPNINAVSIPNGVNVSRFTNALPYSKKDLLDLDNDVFLVAMVARFDYPKRQDIIIEAISKLPNSFHAVFIGGNKNDKGVIKLQELVKRLCIGDRIHFLYARNDVERILKTVDVIIMSSEYEGLSLSSIERMAVNKPFIASNVNGLREVVNGSGILFENNNSSQLADIIYRLKVDFHLLDATAKKCLSRAGEYDIKRMVNNYDSLYRKYINLYGQKEIS
jgi:glycosyltransferase involved in cell wall biosynthesis